jgi:arylsulfatase A-like enzyme
MLDELRFFTQNRHELDGRPLPKPGEGYHSTTAISDYAVQFLEEHAKEHAADPFFLYLAPHAPHFPLQAPAADIERYKDRFAEGWDTARERKHQRTRRMGLIDCALAPLEANMWTSWNTPDEELRAKIGPGENARAVPWSTLTAEQKKFQRTKMAIHAAMVTRMDLEIGRVLTQLRTMGAERDTVVLFLSDNGASSEQLIRGDGSGGLGAIAPGAGAGLVLLFERSAPAAQIVGERRGHRQPADRPLAERHLPPDRAHGARGGGSSCAWKRHVRKRRPDRLRAEAGGGRCGAGGAAGFAGDVPRRASVKMVD